MRCLFVPWHERLSYYGTCGFMFHIISNTHEQQKLYTHGDIKFVQSEEELIVFEQFIYMLEFPIPIQLCQGGLLGTEKHVERVINRPLSISTYVLRQTFCPVLQILALISRHVSLSESWYSSDFNQKVMYRMQNKSTAKQQLNWSIYADNEHVQFFHL